MWIRKEKFEKEKRDCFLKGKTEVLEEKLTFQEANVSLIQKNYILRNEKQELQINISSLKNKMREQNKADMVFEALQVIISGVKPETKKEDLQNNYLRMLALQQQQQTHNYVGGEVGLFGIGSLLGCLNQRTQH
jgi:hypothetical protein